MESCCKIKFKQIEYKIDTFTNFNSEHSKTKIPHNVYYIVTDAIPVGLITDASSSYAVSANILGEIIQRPEVTIRTKMNIKTKQLQYTIIISDKGE